ncbi:adrenocortical dysplasia protein homolog [Discoglossus pictus]
MARHCIGRPWILDALAKYETANVKYKPVPAQVVEFVKMQDGASEDPQCPAAVVHISDRKYYIRGIITREAKNTMEREDEHFTLADIKNKMIILKDFNVCFTEVEDLKCCEFYITVQKFCVLPMETDSVDLLNCNMNPEVRKKIVELWQNYMAAEIALSESSADMNLSDVCLTQLLNAANDDVFDILKSCAEQCLDLDSPQENLQSMTKWGAERREDKSANPFSIPMNLLLIPSHEEAALAVMEEFRNDTVTSNGDDPVDEQTNKGFSPMSFSTALSPMCEDPMDDMPTTQTVNPWNKLPSLCLSVTSSSASQTKSSSPIAHQSSEEESVDPDSSTPDIFDRNLPVPNNASHEKLNEISPLFFSDRSQHSDRSVIQETTNESDDTMCKQVTSLGPTFGSSSILPCGQARRKSEGSTSPHILQSSLCTSSNLLCGQVDRKLEGSSTPLQSAFGTNFSVPHGQAGRKAEGQPTQCKLLPVTQSAHSSPNSTSPLQSSQTKMSLGSHVNLSPIVCTGPERDCSPKNIRRLIFPSAQEAKETKRNHNQLRERKAVKRKKDFEETDYLFTEADIVDNHEEPIRKVEVRRLKTVSNTCLEEDNTTLGDTNAETKKVTNIIIMEDPTALNKNIEKQQGEQGRLIRKPSTANPTVFGNSFDKTVPNINCPTKQRLPEMKRTEEVRAAIESATTSRASVKKASSTAARKPALTFYTKEKNIQPVIEMNHGKMTHYDGSPFQYKYKPPSQDLCTRVNSIKLPSDLSEWAVKYLSEQDESP